jgi:hypothetical protein
MRGRNIQSNNTALGELVEGAKHPVTSIFSYENKRYKL